LTKVKWLSTNQVIATSNEGELFLIEVKVDAQNALFLERPKLAYKTDCAIWDIAVLRKSDN